MSVRRTLLLWLCVAALGLYVWASRRPGPAGRRQPPPARGGAPVLQFTPGDVAALAFVAAGGTTTTLRRDAGGWRNAGTGTPVASDAVDAFLRALADLRPLATITPLPEQLGDYGLDPPRQRITIWRASGGAPLALALGHRNPAGTAVYARTGTGTARVLLVGALILWELDKLGGAARQAP